MISWNCYIEKGGGVIPWTIKQLLCNGLSYLSPAKIPGAHFWLLSTIDESQHLYFKSDLLKITTVIFGPLLHYCLNLVVQSFMSRSRRWRSHVNCYLEFIVALSKSTSRKVAVRFLNERTKDWGHIVSKVAKKFLWIYIHENEIRKNSAEIWIHYSFFEFSLKMWKRRKIDSQITQ